MKRLRDRYRGTNVRDIELIGVSGTVTMNNREVLDLIAKLALPDNDGIATSAIDRVMRPKGFGAVQLFDAFIKHKKCIWSEADGFIDPTTNEGFMKLWDALGRSSGEWRRLCERIQAGMLEKRDRLELPYMRCPYAYRLERKRIKIEDRTYFAYDLILHPDDAEKQKLVRRIFRMSSRDGLSDHAIAKTLNVERIPGPMGGVWHKKTITNILDNSVYVGYVRQGRPRRNARRTTSPLEKNIPCPRLLEDDRDWKIAQARAQKNYEQWVGRKSETHQLQSLIWCAKPGCGHRMCGKKVGRGYRKYRCNHLDKTLTAIVCDAPAIKGERVEDAIWRDVCGHLSDARRTSEMLREFHRGAADRAQAGDTDARKIERLKAERKALERNLDDPEQQYRWADLKQRLQDLQVKLSALEAARTDGDDKVVEMPSRATLEALAAVIRRAAEWTSYQDRRPLLLELVKRVDYFDGAYEVTLKIPANEAGINALDCGRNREVGQTVLSNFVPLKISGKIAA